MKPSSYNFLQVSGGRTFFARVAIEPTTAQHGLEISVARTAFEDPKGLERHPDWADAAERGIRYALAQIVLPRMSGIHLLVTSILGTEVVTCADAAEVSGANPPRFEAGKFVFKHD